LSDTAHRLTRRQALGLTAGLTAGALLATAPTAAASAPERSVWREPRSQNGWPVIDGNGAALLRVEGTNVNVPLLKGDVAAVLVYVARRFAYEIDMLRPGDVQGHTDHRTVGPQRYDLHKRSGRALPWLP
jgi:hypothetical protein